MTVELAGDPGVPSTDPRVQYTQPQRGRVGYTLRPEGRRPVRVQRAGGRIRIEEPLSRATGEGASYLEALQALQKAIRERRAE